MAIDIVSIRTTIQLHSFLQFLFDISVTGSGCECRQPVFVCHNAVERHTFAKFPGPAHEGWHAVGPFPVGVLLAAKRRRAGVGPGIVMRAVVGRVEHDRVVGDAEFVEQNEQLADVHVVLDHAIVVLVAARSGDAGVLFLDVGTEVHARAVPPGKPRLALAMIALDEFHGRGEGFLVDGFHALLGQRTGVDDGLRAVAVGHRLEYAARAPLLEESLAVRQHDVARIIPVFGFLFGIQVIQVSEKFVETVVGRQMLVTVTEMVLAELPGRIAERFHHRGDGDIRLLPAFLGAGQADLGHAGAHRHHAANERRAPGGAGLLPVVIGEGYALSGNTVDIGRLVPHHAAVVVADIRDTDIVTPDDEDIGFSCFLGRGAAGEQQQGQAHQPG